MAERAVPRESVLERAAPIYVALLFCVLTVVGVVLLFWLRHVLLILFVSVLFAAALSGPSEWRTIVCGFRAGSRRC